VQDLLTYITPALVTLFGAALTFIINRGAGALQAAAGIDIEASHREALHSAIMTGVKAAVARGPVAGIDAVKAEALAYARASVPDAIRALVPGETVLDAIAERYVLERLEEMGIGLEPLQE